MGKYLYKNDSKEWYTKKYLKNDKKIPDWARYLLSVVCVFPQIFVGIWSIASGMFFNAINGNDGLNIMAVGIITLYIVSIIWSFACIATTWDSDYEQMKKKIEQLERHNTILSAFTDKKGRYTFESVVNKNF